MTSRNIDRQLKTGLSGSMHSFVDYTSLYNLEMFRQCGIFCLSFFLRWNISLPEFTPVFSDVRVTRSLFLCVCFVVRCLLFCPFCHCVVCSSIYRFWLHFGIFKVFFLAPHLNLPFYFEISQKFRIVFGKLCKILLITAGKVFVRLNVEVDPIFLNCSRS
jgi:hypothetical protein